MDFLSDETKAQSGGEVEQNIKTINKRLFDKIHPFYYDIKGINDSTISQKERLFKKTILNGLSQDEQDELDETKESLYTKSLKTSFYGDENFLNLAYYTNIKKAVQELDNGLEFMLENSQNEFLYNIGEYRLIRNTQDLFLYEYNNFKDEIYLEDDIMNFYQKFKSEIHFANNIQLKVSNNRSDTLNNTIKNEYFFIIVENKLINYFKTKNLDFRLVLIGYIDNDSNLSKVLNFAILNVKSEYKNYQINNLLIPEGSTRPRGK